MYACTKQAASFLMLPVIIWSPLEQYQEYINSECPKCELDTVVTKSKLVPCGWTNSESIQPRLIHCVNNNVILVSRIYCCENNHRVLGHHPGIIRKFVEHDLKCVVPFHLWHVTGCTIPLVQYISDMADSGVSLRRIEAILSDNRLKQFYTIKQKFHNLHRVSSSSEPPTFPDFESESMQQWKSSPTYHAISAFYLMNFWQSERSYHQHMSQLSINPDSSWLSCDHTFKSVRNIGFIRSVDDKWINQYKGLFCVLNSEGQVLSWKITKGLALHHVQDMLESLRNRLHQQGVSLKEFYVDNCCSLRQKLQQIFGSHLQVYLDVFHAIQRISKKIPKKHPYNSECLKSLRLVFRQPGDQGKDRTMSTPSIEQLRSQLLAFKSKWNGIECNGKPVLPPAAITQIQSLLVHVNKGCLSGILPGRGTNRNERLHRELNACMSNSKYGIEFSYALLTQVLFTHNEFISAATHKRRALPISAYKHNVDSVVETFGLQFINRGDMHEENPTVPILPKVHMKELEHHQVQEALSTIQINVFDESENCDSQFLEDTLVFDFTSEDALFLLKQSVSSFYVSKSLQAMSLTVDLNGKDIFFVSFLALIQGLTKVNQGQTSYLDTVLNSWNFERVSVNGDGSCLFTSVASTLVRRVEKKDTVVIQLLLQLGVPEVNLNDISCIGRLLRVKMVEEWIQNIEYYQGFLTEDLSDIAQDFLDSSQFSGNAGDLMVLTLSNILQMPITIFTSAQNMPLVCILPTTQALLSTHPICLAYTQDSDGSPGHYDYVVESSSPTQPKRKALKCTCGRKRDSESALICSTIRCPCYREKKTCSKLCTCKHCNNHFGKRPSASSTRRRQSYDEQRQKTSGKKSLDFMKEAGEINVDGYLTLLEVLLIKVIITSCIIKGIEASEDNVFHMFTIVCGIANECTSVQFPLFARHKGLIKQHLTKVFHSIELLLKLFQ